MMLSNVNNTGLIGRQLYAIAEDGDKSIAITDEGLVIGKNLNDDPEFVTLNSDGITRDGVTTTWADIGGGGGDISVIEEEIEDIQEDIGRINGKLTAVASAPDNTTLKVVRKIDFAHPTLSDTGSIGLGSGGLFEITTSGNMTITTGTFRVNASYLSIGTSADAGLYGVAIGNNAGSNNGSFAVAIGASAGDSLQGSYSVSIGASAGKSSKGSYSVAMGYLAGETNQGSYSIAIGTRAGQTSQHSNSIILYANGNSTGISTPASGTFIVDPVRNITGTNIMTYNTTTKEISYSGLFTNGTWTPTLTSSDSTMTISPTYSVQYGVYQRDCNVVFINGSITLTSKGNTANTLRIGGIPIAFTNGYAIGQLNCYPMISNCIGLRMVGATGNLIKIQKRIDAVSDWTDLTINDIGDTTVLTFSCTYYLN